MIKIFLVEFLLSITSSIHHCFSAPTRIISNHPCPTCLCFQVDSRVIIFIRWICKYICRRINRSQFLRTIRARNANNRASTRIICYPH